MTRSKYGIDERKKRWIDFYNYDGLSKKNFIITTSFNENSTPTENTINPFSDRKKKHVEDVWNSYNAALERIKWLRDDYIPHIAIGSGTEIFAEAFGCKVKRPDNNMPFALPMVFNASDAEKIKVPKLEDSSLMYFFDIGDELKKRAGEDAVFRLVDIQSPIDIVAQIWDKKDLFAAMIEEPEAVKELASKVKELLTAFLDEWFRRYGREIIAHFPFYYMTSGITLSEDEIGSISAAMFNEFCLDELCELSERYGGIGIHCCANAKHQWDNLKKISGLKLLNFVQPMPIIEEALPYFTKEAAQYHYCHDEHTAAQALPYIMPQGYPEGSRVVIEAVAKSRDEALELSDKLWKYCGRE